MLGYILNMFSCAPFEINFYLALHVNAREGWGGERGFVCICICMCLKEERALVKMHSLRKWFELNIKMMHLLNQ